MTDPTPRRRVHPGIAAAGLLALVYAAVAWYQATEQALEPLAVGDLVPGLELASSAGSDRSLRESGRPTLVAFYRGWW